MTGSFQGRFVGADEPHRDVERLRRLVNQGGLAYLPGSGNGLYEPTRLR